jgi:hypothetical protein
MDAVNAVADRPIRESSC